MINVKSECRTQRQREKTPLIAKRKLKETQESNRYSNSKAHI